MRLITFLLFFAKKLFNATSIANANLLEDTTTKVLSLYDAITMKIKYTIEYVVKYIILFNGDGNGFFYMFRFLYITRFPHWNSLKDRNAFLMGALWFSIFYYCYNLKHTSKFQTFRKIIRWRIYYCIIRKVKLLFHLLLSLHL